MAPKAGSAGATATATVMDDPDKEKPQTFRSLPELAEYCGVKDVEGFKAWLKGPLFQPTFQELYDEAIAPQQQKASEAGKGRPRTMNAKTIESAMQLGEAYGSRMFSARRVDKTDWELPEYYAYCMYNLITDNSQDFKGLFYGQKNVREHTKFCRLWACLRFELYEMAPSRQTGRKEAEEKAEMKEAKRVPQEVDRKSKKKRKSKDGKASRVVSDEVTEVPSDDTSVADGQEIDDEMNEEDRLHLERIVGRQQHHQESVNSFINHVYTGQSGILNEMLLERKHAEMNLEDRFWQDYLLGLLGKAFSSQYRLTQGDMINTTEALDATDEMMRDAIEKTGDSSDLLPVKLATNEDFEAYRTNAILQDNVRFQPQGHQRACNKLRLDADHPRFDCMPLAKSFQFWQVVAIAQMMCFSKLLRGCLLCDSMGLGKTWELVGLVLQYVYRRERMIAKGRGDELDPARPTIVAVPSWLLEQWQGEIMKIAGRKLKVLKYYGDPKEIYKNPLGTHPLTRNHSIFDGREANASTIILTTPRTMASRHGPTPLKAYRITTLKMSTKNADKLLGTPDKGWKHNLHGLFEYCIIDEAQSIKNPDSYSHLAMLWLDARFNALATCTPDINSVACIEGYAHFIQSSDDLWTPDKLTELNLAADVNPYTLEDNTPASKLLRPTVYGLKKFILDPAIGEAFQGLHLAAFFQACMIRRTHASKLEGRRIGDALPPLTHKRAICPFTREEQRVYNALQKTPTKKLVRKNDKGEIVWNWRYYRILLLISTWTGFYHIHAKFHAHNIPALLRKKDLLGYIIKLHCKANPSVAVPENIYDELKLVFTGSPKLRAIMAFARSLIVRRKEKVVIFVTLPGQMALYHAVFQKLQIPSACLAASLKGPDKVALISTFNSGERAMALIGNFCGMGTGFNLQESCQWVLFADDPPSEPIGAQAGARVHRLGVPGPVEVVTHYTPKSINDRQLKNLRKAFPGTMAMMDNSIFRPHVGGEEASSSLDHEEVIQVGTWVRFKGRIVPADDERVRDLNLERLKGTKVVQAILEQKMDVPGSFGAVGSDGEEDESAGKEADNGEDLDEDDLTSIDGELDEQMSDTLISSGDEDA